MIVTTNSNTLSVNESTMMKPHHHHHPHHGTSKKNHHQHHHRYDDGCASVALFGDDEDITDITDIDSEDEFAVAAQKEKYSKCDQDVAVFLQVAERMSLESLIFLLQGQAQAAQQSHFAITPFQQRKAEQQEHPLDLPHKVKKFRFAEVGPNRQVREVIHEIQSIKHHDELWWQDEEMRSFRTEAIKIVKFYSKNCQDYVSAVEDTFVAENSNRVRKQIKKLCNESYVRGFEAHIVTLLTDRRDLYSQAILALAEELHNKDYDTSSKIIGDACKTHSKLAREFALRLAQIDHVEALKANLSK